MEPRLQVTRGGAGQGGPDYRLPGGNLFYSVLALRAFESPLHPEDEQEKDELDGVTNGHVELDAKSRDEAEAGSRDEEDAKPYTTGGGTLTRGATT